MKLPSRKVSHFPPVDGFVDEEENWGTLRIPSEDRVFKVAGEPKGFQTGRLGNIRGN